MSRKITVALVAVMLIASPSVVFAEKSAIYRGMCDASTAVPLDQEHFIVADDEDKESDLEGAAVVGSRIYWISSHGTNKKGKVQDRRRRLFATDIVSGSPPTVTPVGRSYNMLVDDLSTHPALQKYKLAKAAKLPPKSPGGLSIEGLASTPGGGLLIGFRNPVPKGKALIIPLENPDAVVRGARASLGKPMEVELHGQGIRSLERDGDSYLIVAGEVGSGGLSKLYRWSGREEEDPKPIEGIDFSGFNPEALFLVPNRPELQILSDDGKVEGDKCGEKTFRSMTIVK
jgi:Protein of unknown function (DUF3616)